MNRRIALLGALASTLPIPTRAQSDAPLALERLIVEVIQAGDMSVLPDIIAPDVTVPDYDISGLDAFIAVSEASLLARQTDYSDYEFAIQVIAESDGWQLAYVRLYATTKAGQALDETTFYAARVDNGLIAEFFVGGG